MLHRFPYMHHFIDNQNKHCYILYWVFLTMLVSVIQAKNNITLPFAQQLQGIKSIEENSLSKLFHFSSALQGNYSGIGIFKILT